MGISTIIWAHADIGSTTGARAAIISIFPRMASGFILLTRPSYEVLLNNIRRLISRRSICRFIGSGRPESSSDD